MQEKALQDRLQKHALEQECYWSQRYHQNWIKFGDKNSKFFQTEATRKDNFIWKIIDEHGNWYRDQVFDEFRMKIQKGSKRKYPSGNSLFNRNNFTG